MTPKPDFLSIIKLVIYYDVMYPNPKKKNIPKSRVEANSELNWILYFRIMAEMWGEFFYRINIFIFIC